MRKQNNRNMITTESKQRSKKYRRRVQTEPRGKEMEVKQTS